MYIKNGTKFECKEIVDIDDVNKECKKVEGTVETCTKEPKL